MDGTSCGIEASYYLVQLHANSSKFFDPANDFEKLPDQVAQLDPKKCREASAKVMTDLCISLSSMPSDDTDVEDEDDDDNLIAHPGDTNFRNTWESDVYKFPAFSKQTKTKEARERNKRDVAGRLSPREKNRRNVSDLSGQNSEDKTASLPLVRGPANQSRDQDSPACDDSSISIGAGGCVNDRSCLLDALGSMTLAEDQVQAPLHKRLDEARERNEIGRFSAGNEDGAMKKEEGSRKVPNLSSPVSAPGVNDRSCLLDALDSILGGNIGPKVRACMRSIMPSTGNTPIKVANQALQPHGLYLKRVMDKFCDNKPGGVEYNLLRLRECQMVLALDLTLADGSGVAHHSIGWNGKALFDRPNNLIIEEKDRSDPKHARTTFDELFPKETFEDWRIVQAFVIAKLGNKDTRKLRKRMRVSGKRKRATNAQQGKKKNANVD